MSKSVGLLPRRPRGSTLGATLFLVLLAPAADAVWSHAQDAFLHGPAARAGAEILAATRAPTDRNSAPFPAAIRSNAPAPDVRPTIATIGRGGAPGSPPFPLSNGIGHSRLLTFAYDDAVRRAALRYAIDPRLVLAIIELESGGDPAAISPSGAIGLMQLMPTTARALGVDPWNPVQNIEGAVRYLGSLVTMFGSVELSLVAYNAGPAFAMRYRGGEVGLTAETRSFLIKVRQMLPSPAATGEPSR